MDQTSEAILALKPVTFRYKKELDPEGIPQFGLVAEEVEKVNPDLVARDAEGNVYTVRYEAVNAMLDPASNPAISRHASARAGFSFARGNRLNSAVAGGSNCAIGNGWPPSVKSRKPRSLGKKINMKTGRHSW